MRMPRRKEGSRRRGREEKVSGVLMWLSLIYDLMVYFIFSCFSAFYKSVSFSLFFVSSLALLLTYYLWLCFIHYDFQKHLHICTSHNTACFEIPSRHVNFTSHFIHYTVLPIFYFCIWYKSCNFPLYYLK